ncbi:MAG: hypothetical protein RIQ89_242 [Bacteroidota bacterium]|jgi:predicted enzyme related to lactoylglutathione lyase
MKKKLLLLLALTASFGMGFAINKIIEPNNNTQQMKKVTGIGGIFFKCKDPKNMRAWYEKHLGIVGNEYGAVFEWYQGADNTKKGFTNWSPFSETTQYFEPSKREFMINYRVADIEALVTALKAEGVTVVDSIEAYDYGKFVHILDAEGNKIELWEPNDQAYEKLGEQLNTPTNK